MRDHPHAMPRTLALKRCIGSHAYAGNPRQLTLQEMGALVIAAGCESGFLVEVEVPVDGGKIDCAWYSADRHLVVAWEFDGRDVGRTHLFGKSDKGIGNQAKLLGTRAPQRVQALYTLRNERLLPPQRSVLAQLDSSIHVVADETLMHGGIEDIVVDALREAQEKGHAILP